MNRTLLRAGLALCVGLFAAAGAQADQPSGAPSGRLMCGGNYAVNSAGIKIQGAFWTLRNRNDAGAITVTAIRIYDARGTLIYDSSVSGLPPSVNEVLGPDNAVLAPHQAVLFSTDQLLSSGALVPLPRSHRPIELDVDWSGKGSLLPLSGSVTRVTRSGVTGEDIARAGFACRDTHLPVGSH